MTHLPETAWVYSWWLSFPIRFTLFQMELDNVLTDRMEASGYLWNLKEGSILTGLLLRYDIPYIFKHVSTPTIKRNEIRHTYSIFQEGITMLCKFIVTLGAIGFRFCC